MTSGITLAILAAFYFIRALIKEDNTTSEVAYQKQLTLPSPAQLEPARRLEYIVNNKKIPCAFERYYYVKLKMPLPIMKIETAVIERHYQQRLQDNRQDRSTLNDIEAANRYFIDRLGYLSHLN